MVYFTRFMRVISFIHTKKRKLKLSSKANPNQNRHQLPYFTDPNHHPITIHFLINSKNTKDR